MKIHKDLVNLAIEMSSDHDLTVDMRYSGRGMLGKECLAVTTPSVNFAYMFMYELAARMAAEEREPGEVVDEHQIREQLSELIAHHVRMDNLGYDTVVYWPSITIEGV